MQDFIVLLWSTGWWFPLKNYKQSVVSVLLPSWKQTSWQKEAMTKSGSFEHHYLLEMLLNIDTYWEFLVKSLLKFVIRCKQCRLLPGGVSMQHGNAHLYSSRKRVAKRKEFSIETSHTCLTRPFTGCYNLFGILTSGFSWFSFETDRKSEWALQVGCVTDEENASIMQLVNCWQACLGKVIVFRNNVTTCTVTK